ncbi:hypothetical protein ZWY2020_049408 [Hordeum vulgare]|nr:hypothetical protein ZWY2020_049408 [Hordeum vulgare]
MQSYRKLCVSTSTPMFGHQDWTHLPKDMFQSILFCLGPIRDLLAFVPTCHSWRESNKALCTLFPPLLIQLNMHVRVLCLAWHNGHRNLQAWNANDPAKQSVTLHCHIDEQNLQKMHSARPSYGRLIFYNRVHCVVVDPFRGTKILPPRLPFSTISYRVLLSRHSHSSPLTSRNTHMLVSTGLSLFNWLVGGDTWSELHCSNVQIIQIVEFNGKFITMDLRQQIYPLEMVPKLRLEEITSNRPVDLTKSFQDPSKSVMASDLW